MRWILALFFALACDGWSACGPTDVNAWDLNGNLNSRCDGGEALAQTGTVSFGATACSPWTQGATTITDANHPKAGTTTLAAMQGLDQWTAAGWVYTRSTLVPEPAVIEFYQSGTVNVWVQILNTGAIRAGRNNAVAGDSGAGIATTSTCYYVAVVGTSGNRLRVSWSPASSIDSTFDIDAAVADAALPGAMTSINFGRLALAAGRDLNNGFLYGWRFRNVAESSFPLTDQVASSSVPTSPYSWQRLTNLITPRSPWGMP